MYAAFGQVELDVGEKGELALALRYDKEDRSVDNKVPNVLNAQIFGQFGRAPINPPTMAPRRYDSQPGQELQRMAAQDQLHLRVHGRVQCLCLLWVGFRSDFNNIGSEATINNAFGSYPTAPQNVRDNYDKGNHRRTSWASRASGWITA